MTEGDKSKEVPLARAEIRIGISQSPEGDEGIKMVWGNENWFLLTVKRAPLADEVRKQLQENFGVKAIAGMAFNEEASLSKRELLLIEINGAVGVYVPEDQFDRLRGRGFK